MRPVLQVGQGAPLVELVVKSLIYLIARLFTIYKMIHWNETGEIDKILYWASIFTTMTISWPVTIVRVSKCDLFYEWGKEPIITNTFGNLHKYKFAQNCTHTQIYFQIQGERVRPVLRVGQGAGFVGGAGGGQPVQHLTLHLPLQNWWQEVSCDARPTPIEFWCRQNVFWSKAVTQTREL